jgi:uridine monophosphate synthetase
VTDVVVLIDREQGGADHLAKNGLQLHAAFKLSAMLDVLLKHKLVDEATAQKVRAQTLQHCMCLSASFGILMGVGQGENALSQTPVCTAILLPAC